MKAATLQDLDAIEAFYDTVIDEQEGREEAPRWIKGVYPSRAYLEEAVRNNEMFIIKDNNEVVAALVFNHIQTPGYSQADWVVDCAPEQTMVFHTFAVAPHMRGKGYARRCMNWVIEEARRRGMKSIRFDVIGPNKPAMAFYKHLGFDFRSWVKLEYTTCGLTDFALYEYVL